MFALKKQFERSHFRRESLLSLDCAVAFTDGEIPSNIPTHLALMITSHDARDPDRLAKILKNHAGQMRPSNIKRSLSEDWTF